MQKFGEMCITIYRDNTHHAKLANHGAPGIWAGYAHGHPTSTYQVFKPKKNKIILMQDMSFLQKSYSDYSKFEKICLGYYKFWGSDVEEELKMMTTVSQNSKNSHVVSNSNSDINDENQENFFDEDIDKKRKQTPRPLPKLKWFVQ